MNSGHASSIKVSRVTTIKDVKRFEEHINKGSQPIVALFCATWCPFCVTFKKTFETRLPEIKSQVLIVILDDLDNPIWDKYTIEVVPTLAVFVNGKVVNRINGILGVGLGEKDIVELVDFLVSYPAV